VRRWIAACVLGETLGLAASALLGALVSRAGEETAPGVLLAILPLTGLLEGAALGAAQAAALRAFVRPGPWVGATAGGMAAAWALAGLASWFEPPQLSAFLVVATAGLFGVLVGVVVGGAQSRVLRDRRWLLPSVAAWVAALVASALLSELVPWGPFTARVFLVEALKGAVAGLLLGAVTAPMLLRILADEPPRLHEKRDDPVITHRNH